MSENDIVNLLTPKIDKNLSKSLVSSFLEIRHDLKTGILGRASGGKFVESFVQILQFLDTGNYDKKPNVDKYLTTIDSKISKLSDDLKICCSRVARACYTIRNKRNIAHKADIKTNYYDLKFLYTSTQWILTELVRDSSLGDMDQIGKAIDYIQIPASQIIEDFQHKKTVFGKFSVTEELLILLHSSYPNDLSSDYIQKSLERRAKSSIYKGLKKLWLNKLVNNENNQFKLTQHGYTEATQIIQKI